VVTGHSIKKKNQPFNGLYGGATETKTTADIRPPRAFGRLEGFPKCGHIDLFRSENRSRFGIHFFRFYFRCIIIYTCNILYYRTIHKHSSSGLTENINPRPERRRLNE